LSLNVKRAERFHDSVDAVAGQPGYDAHTAVDQTVGEYIRGCA
jgi:hypothetical protein